MSCQRSGNNLEVKINYHRNEDLTRRGTEEKDTAEATQWSLKT